MARDRVNAGFGPSVIRLTATTAATETSTWVRWGPFKGANLVYQGVFSGTSNGQRIRMQGTLTTASTKGIVSFTLVNSSGTGAQVYSGSTGTFAFVRLKSTGLTGSNVVDVYFAAVN